MQSTHQPMTETPTQTDSARTNQFVELLARHQFALFRYVLAMVPRVQDAEDVMQEVSKMLWQRFSDFEAGTNFLAWARSVAYFRILEFRRNCDRRLLILPEDVLQTIAEQANVSQEREDERHEALARCFDKLRSRDRDLITARYTPGVNMAELAVQIGRPVNSVYKSLGRIRQTLLDCVERRIGQGSWRRGSS